MDNSKNSMTKEKLYTMDVPAEVGHSGLTDVFIDIENRVASTPTGVNKVLLPPAALAGWACGGQAKKLPLIN